MLQSLNVAFSERRFETRDGVKILHDDGDLFVSMCMCLAHMCIETLHTVILSFSHSQDPNARIFLIATFPSHARDIICLVWYFVHVHVFINHTCLLLRNFNKVVAVHSQDSIRTCLVGCAL